MTAQNTAHIDTTANTPDIYSINPTNPLPQLRAKKTPDQIREELATARLPQAELDKLLTLVEEAKEDAQAYTQACVYLTTQAELDADTFYRVATSLGETALRRLAAYGQAGLGLCNLFVSTMIETKIAGEAILSRFYKAAYWHFGGKVEGREYEYNKEQSIIVICRPKKGNPVLTLKKNYDKAILQQAASSLKALKTAVFRKEYKPAQGELVSAFAALCKAAIRFVDTLQYSPKDADKPNKALQALQSATRADMQRLGISETDFCQTIAKELVAYGKQLDKPTPEPADTVTRKADKAEDKADKAEDKAATK